MQSTGFSAGCCMNNNGVLMYQLENRLKRYRWFDQNALAFFRAKLEASPGHVLLVPTHVPTPKLQCPEALLHCGNYFFNIATITYAVCILYICTDPPQPFLEGALMMTEADELDPECAHDRPWRTPVLSTDRFCLTWNADENFARDQIGAFEDKNNVTVKVTVHYMSSESSLVNHGMESGWKTINLDVSSVEPIKDSRAFVDPDAFEGRPLLMDEAAVINLQLNVGDIGEVSNPVPVLFFLKVSVVGAGIDMFTSSPLLSFMPKIPGQTPMTATQCDSIIPKLDEVVVNRLPCPATMRQAFLDPSLVVDPGCAVNPSTPNKAFNCYLNPDAMQCFLQR